VSSALPFSWGGKGVGLHPSEHLVGLGSGMWLNVQVDGSKPFLPLILGVGVTGHVCGVNSPLEHPSRAPQMIWGRLT
jgi:hypothetical protein